MTYKILSLDGGGTWALIQVKALQAIFGNPDMAGHDVLAHFDMAVANSGGSIVLGGLLDNDPLSTILTDFMDDAKRQSIFSPTDDVADEILSGLLHFGPRFSSDKKLQALRALLPTSGDTPLPQVAAAVQGASGNPLHVLIPAFDYDRNTATFFRSADVGGPEWGQSSASNDVTLAEAIHASSNAPVMFFDAPATWDGGATRYWDGAISGCNNPVLAGIAEAIALGQTPTDIRALAIGTATVRRPGPPVDNPPPFVAPRSQSGLANDLGKLAGSVTDDPPDVASYLAHVMTGGPINGPGTSRIIRMNPMVCPVPANGGGWQPPQGWSAAQLAYLQGLDMTALQPHDVDYISSWADLWLSGVAINQPIRMNADTL
ncbi:MAG TPA: patatin-like phospholipase family protein, partial [Caulobacteraceae bacterium]|nr:patatin-like phospholipase family protein [Caulobacteraceae bacterium]